MQIHRSKRGGIGGGGITLFVTTIVVAFILIIFFVTASFFKFLAPLHPGIDSRSGPEVEKHLGSEIDSYMRTFASDVTSVPRCRVNNQCQVLEAPCKCDEFSELEYGIRVKITQGIFVSEVCSSGQYCYNEKTGCQDAFDPAVCSGVNKNE